MEKTCKQLRTLSIDIQDIKRGIAIAAHVLRIMIKSQYDSQKMNKNPGLLSVKNGMIDLRTGELLERERDHYQTFQIDIEYHPTANTSFMKKFIDGMFLQSETDVKDMTCKTVGYAITGEVDKKILPLIVGDGCNGKTELVNILKAVLGKMYVSTVDYADLSQQNNNKNVDTLYNARFSRIIIIIETGKDAQFKEGKLKSISGKDDINVSAKFKGDETMTPECVVFIVSNFKPKFSGDPAFWSRLINIQLNMQFIDKSDFRWDEEAFEKGEMQPKDPSFIRELYRMKEGMLTWLVQQAIRYYKEGIIIPESVQLQKKHYMKSCTEGDNRQLRQYVERTWDKSDEGETTMAEILEQYRKDIKEDALLSDKQIELKLSAVFKLMEVEKRRADKMVDGVRKQTTIWKLKNQEN